MKTKTDSLKNDLTKADTELAWLDRADKAVKACLAELSYVKGQTDFRDLEDNCNDFINYLEDARAELSWVKSRLKDQALLCGEAA